MSIKDLEADYVFVYKSKKPEGLSKLIELLNSKGVYTQIRDYDSKSLLVFVKVANYKYTELAEKDLIKNYEFGISTSIDNQADKLRIIYDYLTGSTIDDLNLTQHKEVENLTPITSVIKDSTIYQDANRHLFTANNPTSNFIKENFGIHIALYFEFVKFLINWVSVLAIFGVISYFKAKHVYSLTYCIVNLVWGVLFISFWKRRENYLISYWGNANYHLIQDHKLKLVDINEYFETKSEYKHNNNYEGIKFLKQLCFIPIAIGCAAVLVSYQLGCFVLEIFINEIYDGPGKSFIGLVPTILISVFVPILSIVFNNISNVLIGFENHNNSYTKNNSILIKQFILNFLTSYMPLIITAFIYLPFAHLIQPNIVNIKSTLESNLNNSAFYYKYLTHLKSQEQYNMNQDRLNLQYNYFMVTNQVIQLIMKYVLPHILKFVFGLLGKNDYKPKDNQQEAKWLETVRKYVALPSYNVNDDLRFATIVYGFLILFGPVWSLGPLVTLGFLVVTVKLDYFKLLNGKYFKPPVPQRVDSIYPWNYALFLLTWLGSIISPSITMFYRHGNKPPKTLGQFALDKASVNVKPSQLIFVLLATEHIFFIIWYILSRLFDLFKTKVEWDNDFTENDIKLRHDHYSAKVKGSLDVANDGDWEVCTTSDALEQAKSIIKGEPPKILEPSVGSSSTGISSSKDTSGLRKIKDDSDEIIKVPSKAGGSEYAIIDHSRHIDPKKDFNEVENEYQQDFEAKQHKIEPEEIVNSATGGEDEEPEDEAGDVRSGTPSTSNSQKSKTRGLKKLLKRKN